MNTVKLLLITKSHGNRPQVFYLIGPGRTVSEVLSCCSLELRSISSNHKAVEWLRTQDPGWSALCCFWHPQRQTFSSKRLTDKKSLAGLYSPPWAPGGKGPTQRISKNYITADLSTHAFLARCYALARRADPNRSCRLWNPFKLKRRTPTWLQQFGHQSWLFKSRANL